MKKNFKNGLLISAISLIVGFFAIAFPFKFFENLTSSQMTILFVTELVVYILVGLTFLVFKGLEEQKREKEQFQREQRKAKICKLQTEWFDLVA